MGTGYTDNNHHFCQLQSELSYDLPNLFFFPYKYVIHFSEIFADEVGKVDTSCIFPYTYGDFQYYGCYFFKEGTSNSVCYLYFVNSLYLHSLSSLVHSHWSRIVEAWLSLVESYRVFLCQLSYVIKNKLVGSKMGGILLPPRWFLMALGCL